MGVPYGYRFMPDSPDGREIERLESEGYDIWSRGRAIESLGERMQKAANTLKLIADEQVGEGESLEAIKGQAADVHADLKTAGERYSPSGTALKEYGQAVMNVRWQLNNAVAQAEAAWEVVQSRASSVEDAHDVPKGEDGSTTARDAARATAEQNLGTAEGEWRIAAIAFDGFYDTWERAYDTAVTSLQSANEDGVEDGFWDNALPFIEALVTVLEWVGVALLIAALVIGGPLIGVLAAIVAVITLIGTIVLFAKGRKNGQDLAFAIIGVIPFGKLGKLAKLGDLAAEGARFPKLAGFRNLFLGADDLGALRTHLGNIDDLASTAWNSTTRGLPFNQITSGSQFIQRVMSGTPYVWQNMPKIFPRSGEMFISRFAGVGDDLAGITDGQRVLSFVQGNATLFSQADFWNSKFESWAADARVDSWR